MSTQQPQTWLQFNTGPLEPALNMALDEAMLEQVSALAHPILRFYGWTEPAATFGYFQPYEQIAAWTTLRPIIRRPTAGGLVPHDADWTYSLAVPPGHPWYELRAEESYRQLHEWVQEALRLAGVSTEVSPCCDKTALGRCFAGPEKFDLVHEGHKIAGAAQRRARHGLLIQGSVQPIPAGMERSKWEQAMLKSATERWVVSWQSLRWKETFHLNTSGGILDKYRSDTFNRRR